MRTDYVDEPTAPRGSSTPTHPRRGRALPEWLDGVLILLAVFLLGWQAASVLDAWIYRARNIDRFRTGEVAVSSGGSADEAPATGESTEWNEPLASGETIGMIEVRRLGISAMIAEGTGEGTLRRAVGHVEGTSLPGPTGNVGLAAHRDSFFRKLREIQPSDTIRVVTERGAFEYLVDSTLVVDPDRVDLLAPSEIARLTLVTCYPFGFIGPAPQRFVVTASQGDRTTGDRMTVSAPPPETPTKVRRAG